MSTWSPAHPRAFAADFLSRLAVVGLLTMAGCTPSADPPTDPPSGALGSSVGPPVDVAGHLAIAGATRTGPFREPWTWGAVPVGVAVAEDGSVYWSQYRTDTVERADSDGVRIEAFAPVDGPLGVAYLRDRQRLYFVTDRHFPRTIGRLASGAKPVSVVGDITETRPFAIAVAELARRVFWTESVNGRIRAANLDGSDAQTIFDDGIASGGEADDVVAMSSFGIAVDEKSGFLFWSDLRNSTITRARFDGSERRTILSAEQGVDFPTGLAVDGEAGKIYWADPGSETIRRANLDGTQPEIFADESDEVLEPYGLAIDHDRDLLYWTDIARNALFRKPVDAGPAERFVDLGDTCADGAGDSGAKPATRCEEAAQARGGEFLQRWMKSIRTCVLDVSSTKTVLRSVSDYAVAASTCRRQLSKAGDDSRLREGLAQACDAGQIQAEIDRLWTLGAEIVFLDLPRARGVLRAVRPFIYREDSDAKQAGKGMPGTTGTSEFDGLETSTALEALDRLLGELERLAQRHFDARRPNESGAGVPTLVPASGQTTSYLATVAQEARSVSVPDDGRVRAGPALRYVDHEDGTLTDTNTGLMWEKKCRGCGGLNDVDARFSWTESGDSSSVFAWLDALNSQGGSGFGGYSDWRLPTVAEMLSIVHFERFNPAVADAFDGTECGLGCESTASPQCSCTGLSGYWSHKRALGLKAQAVAAQERQASEDASIVPVLAFHLGLVWGRVPNHEGLVRAVRGPRLPRTQRYIHNGDGTITDRVTGLMWEKKVHRAKRFPGGLGGGSDGSSAGGSDGGPDRGLHDDALHDDDLHDVDRRMYWSFDGNEETVWDWIAAVNAEGGVGFAGHDDWRIPNIKELYSLFDENGPDPYVDPAFAGGPCSEIADPRCSATSLGSHWTSTTFADFPSLALATGFSAPGAMERDPPPWIIRVVGGVEPHEKTRRMVTRAVRGPVDVPALVQTNGPAEVAP